MAQPCSGLTTTTKLLLAAALLGLGCWYMLFMPDVFVSTRQTVPPTFDRRQAGFQAGDATVGTIPIVIFGEASQTALTTVSLQ